MIVLRFKRGVVLLSWRLFFLCCGLPTRQWKVSLAGLPWCICMSVLFSFGSCALGIFSCEAVNPRKGFRGRVEHLNYLTEQSCSLMAKVHNLTSANKGHTRKSVLINDFCASERVMNFDPFYTRQSLTSKSPFLKSRIILFSKKSCFGCLVIQEIILLNVPYAFWYILCICQGFENLWLSLLGKMWHG